MRAARRLLLLIALSMLAVPAAASASTLTRAGGVYDYTGSAAINNISVNGGTSNFSISDIETITMAADGSCTGENTTNVTCSVTPTSFDYDTGGNNDSSTVQVTGIASIPITGRGGSGNDSLTLTAQFTTGSQTLTLDDSSGNDVMQLNGTSISGVTPIGIGIVSGGTGTDDVSGTNSVNGNGGDDKLRGLNPGTGNVTLNGGTENDTFLPSDTAAPELINGGAGTDTVDYGSVGSVIVTLDAVQNDGQIGSQTDNVNADGLVEILRTGNGNDNVTGGVGNDSIFTGDGTDTVNGGGGDDFIDAGFGADTVNGGANGVAGDTVDYSARAFPLRVSPDGLAANDGEAAEFDNVGSDIENVVGGFNNDSIGGNPSNNNFNGGLGEDSFDGAAGNDTLTGGSGDDNLDGGANNDTISGGPGDDTIDGGADTDVLNGDGGSDLVDGDVGTDTLNGNAGSDTVLSRDNAADTVNCGSSTDHSVRDNAGDTVNADCEISDTGAAGFSLKTIGGQQVVTGSTEDAAVTCISTRVRRSGRARVQCVVSLSTPGGKLRGRLVRGKRTLARGARLGSGHLTLSSRRRAARGRYTLVLTQAGHTVARVPIRIR